MNSPYCGFILDDAEKEAVIICENQAKNDAISVTNILFSVLITFVQLSPVV